MILKPKAHLSRKKKAPAALGRVKTKSMFTNELHFVHKKRTFNKNHFYKSKNISSKNQRRSGDSSVQPIGVTQRAHGQSTETVKI